MLRVEVAGVTLNGLPGRLKQDKSEYSGQGQQGWPEENCSSSKIEFSGETTSSILKCFALKTNGTNLRLPTWQIHGLAARVLRQ